MNLFTRIGHWLRTVFFVDDAQMLDKNPRQVKQEVLSEFDKHLADINRAMVHLVFERKNLEESLRNTQSRKSTLEEDLKNCLYEDKDQLAEDILQELDQAKSEEKFYLSQLDAIRIELDKAKEADREMRKQAHQARHQMNLLVGKQKILRLRKQLLQRLDVTASKIEKKMPLLQKMDDQIRQLEAENEVEESLRPEAHKELEKMRTQRRKSEYYGRVQQLKRQLFQKTLPEAKTPRLVAEFAE